MTRNMGSECSPFVCNLYIMKYPQKLHEDLLLVLFRINYPSRKISLHFHVFKFLWFLKYSISFNITEVKTTCPDGSSISNDDWLYESISKWTWKWKERKCHCNFYIFVILFIVWRKIKDSCTSSTVSFFSLIS